MQPQQNKTKLSVPQSTPSRSNMNVRVRPNKRRMNARMTLQLISPHRLASKFDRNGFNSTVHLSRTHSNFYRVHGEPSHLIRYFLRSGAGPVKRRPAVLTRPRSAHGGKLAARVRTGKQHGAGHCHDDLWHTTHTGAASFSPPTHTQVDGHASAKSHMWGS